MVATGHDSQRADAVREQNCRARNEVRINDPHWLFESVGHLQLARFKADLDNCGKVMDRGLWRYTRHPNYFGDFMVWWGLYLIAASSGAWWTIVSPILMSFLLMRVSGVTLLEHSLKKNRPGYEEYVKRTSPFFPWPPKQTESQQTP